MYRGVSLNIPLVFLFCQVFSGSQDVEDEDNVAELLNAIAAENSQTKHGVRPRPPNPCRRDTDTVLTSLLTSLEPPPSPPDSIPSFDPAEVDSQCEESAYDTDHPSDFTFGREQPFHADKTEVELESDYLTPAEVRQRSLSAASTDSDYDDMDVFEMLRDNSQLVVDMLTDEKAADHNDVNGNKTSFNSIILNGDVPPPIPTTPVPSDDEEPSFKPSLSLRNFSDESGMSSEEAPPPLPSKNGPVKMQLG